MVVGREDVEGSEGTGAGARDSSESNVAGVVRCGGVGGDLVVVVGALTVAVISSRISGRGRPGRQGAIVNGRMMRRRMGWRRKSMSRNQGRRRRRKRKRQGGEARDGSE